MQLTSILTAALLGGSALANYAIDLYEDRNCKGRIGHTCSNVPLRVCCYDEGRRYHSADFEEAAGGACSDQLKIYPGDFRDLRDHCSGPPLDQEPYPRCAKSERRNVAGAKVWEVHSADAEAEGNNDAVDAADDRSTPAAVVPDQTFYQNGTQRWVLARNSTAYAAYTQLTDDNERIEHLVTHGTLTQRTVEVRCPRHAESFEA